MESYYQHQSYHLSGKIYGVLPEVKSLERSTKVHRFEIGTFENV